MLLRFFYLIHHQSIDHQLLKKMKMKTKYIRDHFLISNDSFKPTEGTGDGNVG
jgi:hypothetical protein